MVSTQTSTRVSSMLTSRNATSTCMKRRRRKTLATVAVAALCSVSTIRVEAFSIGSGIATNGPLHLNNARAELKESRHMSIINNFSWASSRRTTMQAVTDPEVLLKDVIHPTRIASSASKPRKSKRSNVKTKRRKNGKDMVNGPPTMINMNMEDLYRLESSYSLDADEIHRNGDVKNRENRRLKSQVSVVQDSVQDKPKRRNNTMAKKSRIPPRTKRKPSKSLRAATAASIALPKTKTRSVTSAPKKGTFTKRKNTGRSSTMPGFINNKSSKRHQSFRDGLSIAKKSNNRRVAAKIHQVLTSDEEQKKRKRTNSEAMYSSSASVPDSLIAFANEFHKESRISPKEEVELGTKTQEAIGIQKIHTDLEEKLGREPTNGEWCAAAGKINMEALNMALEEGIEAKERLITSNLRMVQGVVNLYIRNGLGSQYNAGDLMQEGTTALIRAAEKYEPDRGFRFSTYAMYWIRAAVKRSQILQSRVIHIPQRLHETHKKITKVESELKKELGRKPEKSELAQAVGITEVQLERCVKAMAQQCFSLDAELENSLNPIKADMNKDTMYNILAARYNNVEYKQLQSQFMREDLIGTLRRYLTPREVDLLLLRYGLMDERTLPYGFSGPLTIAEVSRLVGLKPDKVRRMINKSLRQLRHLIAHEWEDFEKEFS